MHHQITTNKKTGNTLLTMPSMRYFPKMYKLNMPMWLCDGLYMGYSTSSHNLFTSN